MPGGTAAETRQCRAQASDWEVDEAIHLLDAFHTVKGPQLEELTQVSLLSM